MNNHRKDRSRYYGYGIILFAALFLVSAAFLVLNFWEQSQGFFPELDPADPKLEYGGKEYVLRENVETFLILGLDKFGDGVITNSYNNDRQADLLMLFVLDNSAKTYSIIHISRDTMVDMNILGVAGETVGTVNKQIALAHTYGNGQEISCRNTADAVSSLLLGMKITHYLSVTMDSVPVFNDLVGGVEVTVLDDFTGIDDTLVKGDRVTLMGQQALTYVRNRFGLEDSSSAARMKRQQQYLLALHEKTMAAIEQDDEFILRAVMEISDSLVSDRTANQLQTMMEKFSDYKFTGIQELEGQHTMGEAYIEFYPDANALKALVVQLFYQEA